ncbi:MAG: hypothetical protein H0X03_03370 [Nitrosopumilus sp.]|nr:hypothetical protein [Nitrosopumilus sp.]
MINSIKLEFIKILPKDKNNLTVMTNPHITPSYIARDRSLSKNNSLQQSLENRTKTIALVMASLLLIGSLFYSLIPYQSITVLAIKNS